MPIAPDPLPLDFLPDGCTPDDVVIHISDQHKRVHVITYGGTEWAYVEESWDAPEDLIATDAYLCMMAFNSAQEICGHA